MIKAIHISPRMSATCDIGPSDGLILNGSGLRSGDLVRFDVAKTGACGHPEAEVYASCARAKYAVNQGYGFARHLRTNVNEKGGVWTGDAVNTISPSLPRGLATLDAEFAVANCAKNGIPTV